MTLPELVKRYLAIAGEFGKPAALSAFGLPPGETEKIFGALDEDYQISRFLHFEMSGGREFVINGFLQTHARMDAEIQSLL
jgi:hypothetical protein